MVSQAFVLIVCVVCVRVSKIHVCVYSKNNMLSLLQVMIKLFETDQLIIWNWSSWSGWYWKKPHQDMYMTCSLGYFNSVCISNGRWFISKCVHFRSSFSRVNFLFKGITSLMNVCKKCFSSIANESQINTTMRYYYTPTKMVKTQIFDNWSGCGAGGALIHCW